jgi:hypothetical protein
MKFLFDLLTVCHVSGSRIDALLLGHRLRAPRKPSVGTVYALVTILKANLVVAVGEVFRRFDGCSVILKVSEIEKRSINHFLRPIS